MKTVGMGVGAVGERLLRIGVREEEVYVNGREGGSMW